MSSDKSNSVWRYLSELNISKEDCKDLIGLLSLRHNGSIKKVEVIEKILEL